MRILSIIPVILAIVSAYAAEVKISDLPETNAPSASAVLPIVDAGVTWKVQKNNLLGSLTNWAKLSTNAAGGAQFWSTNYEAGAVSLFDGGLTVAVGTNAIANETIEDGWGGLMIVGSHNTSLGEPNELTLHFSTSDGGNPHLGYGRGSIYQIHLDTNSFFYSLTADFAPDNGWGGGPQVYYSGGCGDAERFEAKYLDGSNDKIFDFNPYNDGGSPVLTFQSHTTVTSGGTFLSILNSHTNLLMSLFGSGSATFKGAVLGESGISSTATDAFLTFTETGLTNTLGKVGVARFDGTALTYVVKNNANTAVYTNTVSVGHATEIIQAGGAVVITAGSGVVGIMSPF